MRLLLLSALIAVTLAGCGRRGPPTPPGPASAIIYPHSYPAY
jgi:predicted small lipoprotein YifL